MSWDTLMFLSPHTETFTESEDERQKVEHKMIFKCLNFQVMMFVVVIVSVSCAVWELDYKTGKTLLASVWWSHQINFLLIVVIRFRFLFPATSVHSNPRISFQKSHNASINIKYYILNLIFLISDLQNFSKLPYE